MPYSLKPEVERVERLQPVLRSNAFSILVVDDMEANRLLMTRLLNAVGYEAKSVMDGESALVHLRQTLPDLMVLDLEMPGLSGLETLRRIRQSEDAAVAALPVFIATGNVDESLKEAVMAAGANAFFRKPDDLAEMLTQIGWVLSEPRQARPASQGS